MAVPISMTNENIGRVAVVWRGDRQARNEATPGNNRFYRVFEELAAHGIVAEPAVYADDMINEVRTQLLRYDGVLVWVDPISDGKNRALLDPLLRDVAANGPWVSAHPDTILKMGVKEVLHRTKDLGWGTDTHVYRTQEAFQRAFPARLRAGAARVIKQNRGNGGQGVWRVESLPDGETVSVLEARRGSEIQTLPLQAFVASCEAYFSGNGLIVDQPFQARLADGMIRCYVGVDKVVGFGHQLIKALLPPPPQGAHSPEAQPGPRIMHPATAPDFEALRSAMDNDWIPSMMRLLDIDRDTMPIIWDADFLYGPRTDAGDDTYVLCEINVSSVFAIPEQAPEAIAGLVRERLLTPRSRYTASVSSA